MTKTFQHAGSLDVLVLWNNCPLCLASNPAFVCALSAGFRSTCRADAALSHALTSPSTSALVSKARPAWCVTPCCRRAGAKRRRCISCPTNAGHPLRPSSWYMKTSLRWRRDEVICTWKLKQWHNRKLNTKYLPLPIGGSKWCPPAGIQAQNPTEQGWHVFYFWESQGTRYWLYPKLSKYIPILSFLYLFLTCWLDLNLLLDISL